MFNSNEIRIKMQNSECKKTDNNESVFHEKSHDSLYSSIFHEKIIVIFEDNCCQIQVLQTSLILTDMNSYSEFCLLSLKYQHVFIDDRYNVFENRDVFVISSSCY